MSECARCGQCCISVGRTFWRNGDFKEFPELERLAKKTESVDEGLPCGMLQMTDGIAACKIELLYGRSAKPQYCMDYPELACWHEQPVKFTAGVFIIFKPVKKGKDK